MGPIVHREVRLQARQRLTPLLRVTGAALLMGACWWVTRRDPSGRLANGLGVFIGLNKLLLVALWILGPILTADCLSRERREGTLDLLFLTPLRDRDLILGKAAGHALRAFTVLFAAMPVLVIPVLMGGVGWADVLRMFLLHLAVLGLALAAGVLASAVTREWWRAALLGSGLAGAAGAIFAGLYVAAWTWRGGWRVGPGARMASADSFAAAWAQNLRWWLDRHLGAARGVGWFWRNPMAGGSTWESVLVSAGVLGMSLVLVAGAVWVAARALRRRRLADALGHPRGGDGPPGRGATGSDGFRRRSAPLDRDPAGWWFSRRPRAGGVGGWLAVGMAVLLAGVESGPTTLVPLNGIGRVLMALAGLAAVVGFRSERAGGFELLLTTPLAAGAWWWGRFSALGRVWGPPLGVFVLGAGLSDYLRYTRVDPVGRYFDAGWVVAGQYGLLPIHLAVVLAVGIRLALTRLPLVPAWGLAMGATVVLRACVLDRVQAGLLGAAPPSDWTPAILTALAVDLGVQMGIGWVAIRGALGALGRR